MSGVIKYDGKWWRATEAPEYGQTMLGTPNLRLLLEPTEPEVKDSFHDALLRAMARRIERQLHVTGVVVSEYEEAVEEYEDCGCGCGYCQELVRMRYTCAEVTGPLSHDYPGELCELMRELLDEDRA